jgi:hypothetical protein
MDNVLFGAGLPEVVLSAALVGYWLWSSLWKMRVSATLQGRGIRGVLPPLLGRALLLGPLMALAALPIGAFGFCIRAMPANIPWFMRPLFGLPGMLTFSLSALATGTIPLVLILLGLLVGLVTAVLVAVLWPYFPEEALLK